MTKARKIGRTETFESTRGVANRIAGMLQTPQGDIDAVDAPGISTLLITNERDPSMSRIGVLVYDPEYRMGMVAQVDADVARTIGASFYRLAERLSPQTNN